MKKTLILSAILSVYMNGYAQSVTLNNSNNTAAQLQFQEPSLSGSNYTALKAQAQSADITLTLPAAAPTSTSDVLKVSSVSGNNATLSWGSPSVSTVSGHSISFSRNAITANAGNTSYTATTSDEIIGINMSAGTNFTVNLPTASSFGAGKIIIIKIEAYNNGLLPVLTIAANGTDKIDGASTNAFGNAGGSRKLYSDGSSNWYTW